MDRCALSTGVDNPGRFMVMAAPAYCPSCGRAQVSSSTSCPACGQVFDASATQQLAQAAMSAQTVNLLSWLGGVGGGIGGLLLGAWLVYDRQIIDDVLLGFGAVLLAGFVGLFLGSRLVLALLAR